MIKTKDILIFVFAFLVILTVGFGFYLLNDIQKNYKKSPYEVIEDTNDSKVEIQKNITKIVF
ncbi:MAG: hypothetical protein ACJA1H_002575 [Glaciecola sp.]|jgi:hypothetical protein